MTNNSKMPSSTSKIPVPKSAIVSPTHQSSNSPAVSRIPVKKDLGGGGGSRSGSVSSLNKENIQDSGSGAAKSVSRIPDIRTRISPTKETPDTRYSRSPSKEAQRPLHPADRTLLQPADRGHREGSDLSVADSETSDRSRSTYSERSSEQSDDVDAVGGQHRHMKERHDPLGRPSDRPGRQSEARGRPNDLDVRGRPSDLDARGRPSDLDVRGRPSDLDVRGRPSDPGKAGRATRGSKIPLSPGMLDRGAQSGSRKTSVGSLNPSSPLEWEPQMSYEELLDNEPLEIDCNHSSSDNSRQDSPVKRGRTVSPDIYKMRRTSPDVYKMRRTSPDGESVSPNKTRRPSPSKIPISAEYMKFSSGSSSQSPEDYLTPRKSMEDLLTPPVRSPEDKKNRRGSNDQLLHTSDSFQSGYQTAADTDDIDELEMGGGEGLAPQDNLPRAGLHLDLERTQDLPPSYRPQQSNSRGIPQPNWSISKEESPAKRKPHSVSSSALQPAPSSPPPSPRNYHSTSRLPFVPIKESSSVSWNTDSDGSERSGKERRGSEASRANKKNYEAFVMTGERMINLAKTPANLDFQSKYYKPHTTTAPTSEINNKEMDGGSLPTSPSQPTSQQPVHRSKPGACRSLVRNSKSEDQLAVSESLEEEDEYLGQSCHTLISSADMATPQPNWQSESEPRQLRKGSSESSSSKSKVSSSDLLISQKSDPTSPELSTSSLITCSEHYNGESLLDNMSPQSPQSPETPEWSLIANGDSYHKEMKRSRGDSSLETSISNKDNRVIITIGQTEGGTNGLSSSGTSSGTITPPAGTTPYTELKEDAQSTPRHSHPRGEVKVTPPHREIASPPPLQPPSPLSSEEDSDMESLRSYHPPVRNVDIPSAHRLAKRLYNLEGFKKGDISRHLSKNNDFSKAVADEYCKLFDLEGKTLDQALRHFLSKFSLIGETQERERVLLHFSKRYLESNHQLRGHTFQSNDSVHTLTCAIMLLNTDLHNHNLQQRKMSPKEFVENLSELNDGHNFPTELLFSVYNSIKLEPIQWIEEEDEDIYEPEPEPANEQAGAPDRGSLNRGSAANRPAGPALLASSVNLSGQQSGGVNPFLTLPDDSSVDYKRGFVIRKCCFDANGKKTKMGKRGWKMLYLTLRDLVLFCFKDEQSAGGFGAFDNPNIAIRIHHAIAYRAVDYRKKKNVLRLLTSDRAEFLFQTSDEQELFAWLDTINTVVARFSSPQLPAPCSSNSKFQRPLYPSSCSRLSLTDQLTAHRSQLTQLQQQLSDIRDNLPPGGKKLQDAEQIEFLANEKDRYSVYIKALENLLSKNESQLLASPLKLLAS